MCKKDMQCLCSKSRHKNNAEVKNRMQRSQAASFLRLLSVHAWGCFEINVDPISHELNNWDLYSAGPWGCVSGVMAQSLRTLPKIISAMSRCHGELRRCDKRGFVYIRWECGQVGPQWISPNQKTDLHLADAFIQSNLQRCWFILKT